EPFEGLEARISDPASIAFDRDGGGGRLRLTLGRVRGPAPAGEPHPDATTRRGVTAEVDLDPPSPLPGGSVDVPGHRSNLRGRFAADHSRQLIRRDPDQPPDANDPSGPRGTVAGLSCRDAPADGACRDAQDGGRLIDGKGAGHVARPAGPRLAIRMHPDRKSTRLNSSHVKISY